MTPITTLAQLNQTIVHTYITGAAVGLVATVITFFVASAIAWQGGTDTSYQKRRLGYIIVGLLCFFAFYFWGVIEVAPNIRNAGFRSMYQSKLVLASLLEVGVFLVSSIALMFATRRGKYGSILGKIKK